MSTLTLAELRPGKPARVQSFSKSQTPEEEVFLERLMQMGMLEGSEVEMIKEAPFGGAVVVSCRGTLLALRTSEAKRVMVQEL